MIRAQHLRMAARFAAHRPRSLHPFEVQAILTNACNLRCAYCRCPDIRVETLDTAQWRAILRRLGQLGTLRIKFQGGEPTIRPDFPELCRAARAAGIIAAVVTNGQRIADRPELLDDLDECVVSIDSPDAEVHDAQRGPGTHARALETLRLARARGLRTFAVMVMTRRNHHQVERMLELCESLGIGMHAQPVVFGLHYTDDGAQDDLGLEQERIKALHEQLADWKRAGRPLMFSPTAYRGVAQWPDLQRGFVRSEGDSRCMAGRCYVHVEANGDVWPCQQHGASDFHPKNLMRDGIDVALRHVRRHDCGDCWAAYLNERKLLFGLRPAAVWEMLRRG